MTNRFAAFTEPVCRASTILFPDADAFANRAQHLYDGYTYGLYGTPTTEALARRLARLEGAARAILAPSGLAAIQLVNLALLKAGDHMLFPDAMYGPSRQAALKLLARLGIEVEAYAAGAGAGIARSMRANTRLVWVESPGTITMEMQDVPAIAQAARAHGAAVAMDNSWATPLRLRPLALGVDLSVQALTKFAGGHSDVLLGSVAVADEALFRRLRDAQGLLGLNASPDDCSLVLRGLDTLELRLARQAASALEIARRLETHPAIEAVLFPALESHAGHALWQRDCPGAGAVFTVILRAPAWEATRDFADRLRVFRLGASWGGTQSLAAPFPQPPPRQLASPIPSRPLVRLAIGLEDPADLIADLQQALQGDCK